MQPHDVTFEDPSAAWEDPSEPGMPGETAAAVAPLLCFALKPRSLCRRTIVCHSYLTCRKARHEQSAVFVRSLGFHRADERSEGRSARGMGFKERLRLERWLRIIGQLLSNHWCVKCQTRVYTGVYCPSNCPSLASSVGTV